MKKGTEELVKSQIQVNDPEYLYEGSKMLS